MIEAVRLAYLVGALVVCVAITLGLGYWGLLSRRSSLGLSLAGIVLAAGAFLAGVLPNNQIYGPIVAQLPIRDKALASTGTDGLAVANLSVQDKSVALTFDDGPNPIYTEKILAVLAEEQVHATFFVIGEHVRQYPDLVRLETAQGHEVGVHTDQHKDVIRMSQSELAADLAQASDSVEQATGRRPQYFRPPHGFRDPMILAETGRQGMTLVNWSVMSRDWTNPGVQTLVERMEKEVKPGAIILLHDGAGLKQVEPREQTVEAVRIVIRQLKAEGCHFVTLSEALNR